MGLSFDLANQACLVTGATRGIGWASAQALASKGARVAITGVRDGDALAQRVKELQELGAPEAVGFLYDVGDPAASRNTFADLQKRWGRLDLLVNNAGLYRSAMLGLSSVAMIEEIHRVNVQGLLVHCQYAAKLMTRQKSGSIVNLSSIVGTNGSSGDSVYAGSKAAVVGITRSLAKELGPLGIRVNAVAPGYIQTDMVSHFKEEERGRLIASTPLGRAGQAEDVAGAVLFLASDLAVFVTGQVLGVDGGMVL